jgi:hypothetical protein
MSFMDTRNSRGAGHESCVLGSRFFREVWVADFAWCLNRKGENGEPLRLAV